MQENKTKQSKKKWLYILLLSFVPVIWGYGFIATDDALIGGAGPYSVLAGRFLLAGFFLILARLCLGKKRNKFQKSEWVWGTILGGVNFLGFLFQTVGLRTTDPGRGGMLTGTYVVLVPVISCFLSKKFEKKALINAVVFLIGMLFIADWKGGKGFQTGDILCVVCSVFFATQILLLGKKDKGWDPINFNIAQMFSMGGLGLVGALLLEREELATMQINEVVFPILFLAVFSSAFCYVIQIIAQKKLSESLTAILLSLESVLAVAFSLLFGRMDFSYPLLIGSVIMLGASVSASITDEGKTLYREGEECK